MSNSLPVPKSGKFKSTLQVYAPKPQALDGTRNLLAIKAGELTGRRPDSKRWDPELSFWM